MKKVFKFVKGKKDEKKESGGITPSQSGDLISSPAQTPEDERFLGLDNSSGYTVDFCGKDKTLTKLHKAAWQGNLEKLKSALKKIEVDSVDRHNRTALHFAVVQGHPNIVWFLLGNNAKTSICDDEGRTPLLKAIECGHKECMTLLLERGTDINVADYTGNTGLHIATGQGLTDTVSVLLKKGAEMEVSNNAGDYPLHIATKLENKDLVDLFLNSGASVDVLDRENRTPLMLAAKSGNLIMAQLFFERGAQLTIVDSNGWTAHDYAVLSGHESIAAILKPQSVGNRKSEDDSDQANSESWNESKAETSEKDPITQKLKEFFRKCSKEDEEAVEKEKTEDLSDSPNTEVMPPYCQPPRSWEMIQAGMIDENKDGAEPKRRSITTLGTLHSRRESFTEGIGATSPKYTLSLNRKKQAKVDNTFAKQRFSFNEEESLKYWLNEDKTIRKDLEKLELENISSIEQDGATSTGKRESASESDWDSDVSRSMPAEEPKKPLPDPDTVSNEGTLGRPGTMQGVDEVWVANPHFSLPKPKEDDKQNSWDSEEESLEKDGSFPPPPSALELGVDMAKSIKYMKGVSEDHPFESAMERNLWKKAYESHSLDCLEEKDFVETQGKPFKGHARHHSTSAPKWNSDEIPKCQKPCDRILDVNRRIKEQLECYDQALRELAETSSVKNLTSQKFATQNYHSLPLSRTGEFADSRKTNSLNRGQQRHFHDSGPFSMPYCINNQPTEPPPDAENNEKLGLEDTKLSNNVRTSIKLKPGEKLEKKTKRQMLLAMRDVKHAVHVANTFKTSADDQILSPLTRPEGSFDMEEKLSPGSSGETSPGEENPFFGMGRQETVMERNGVRRKSSSSGTGEEPTLWLQEEVQRKAEPGQNNSDEDISEIEEEGTKHNRNSSFSPLGIIHREIQKEDQDRKVASGSPVGKANGLGGEDVENEEVVREQSPDISLSSGPIEPLGTEKDSGSEPESSHNDITPTHNYSLKTQHEWLKSHLKTATSEKSKLEEITAQLSEKTERLQYELADAKEAAKSRDEVIQLLQSQLAKMEAAYTRSLEESVQSRLQLTSHEQEILHLKELCYKYEEEKDIAGAEISQNAFEDLEMKIKALEEEKKRLKEEIIHLEKEKCSLQRRLKEVADSEIIDQCQRWKERCEELGEMAKVYDSQKAAYETYLGNEHLQREKQITERNLELEKKYLEVSEENLELRSKLQNLAGEMEKRKADKDTNESVSELRKKNNGLESRLKNLEKEMEDVIVNKLKEKEEGLQALLKQFNAERESLIISYEKKLRERKSEHSESEIINYKRENERLMELIKSIQDQVVNIQMKGTNEEMKEMLKNELSDLKVQCCEVSKSIAVMQSKDQEEISCLVSENIKLSKEINELKTKSRDGVDPAKDVLTVMHENSKMRSEILDLKNQINTLTVLLDRRLPADVEERKLLRMTQKSDGSEDLKASKKRVGKEDELAWSHLYGMNAIRRYRGERLCESNENRLVATTSSPNPPSPKRDLEFLQLKKEILNLRDKMSDEMSLRHSLESQLVEINFSLKEKENLQHEIHSLKRQIDRNVIQNSEMELLHHQKNLESEREKYLEGVDDVSSMKDDFRSKCERLAREREKCKELKKELMRKSQSFDPGGKLPTSDLKCHSYPRTQPEILLQAQPDMIPSLGLQPDIRHKLDEELDKSIKKYINESSSQSISTVQIELLKKKYFH